MLQAKRGLAKSCAGLLCSQVNADKYGDLGSRFAVKGFPTILYFARGKPVDQHTTCAFCHHSAPGPSC